MRRAVKLLVLLVLLSAAVAGPVLAWCADDPDLFCGIECGWWSGGGVYCMNPSNPTRACWHSGTGGSCGEDRSYVCCGGGGGF